MRPHDHIHWNLDRRHHRFDQSEARRQAALAHRGDKFETVGAGLRGYARVGNGRGNDFKKDGHKRG
jgi:hypothetical protein